MSTNSKQNKFQKNLDTKVLEKLAIHDTPTICNVIELFAVRPHSSGYVDHRVTCRFPELPPMVGFASTASFRSSFSARGEDVYESMCKQVEGFADLPGPAIMVFQDLDDPVIGATFGEVMCTTYQAFGSIGLVTSGAGRDLAQVRDLSYPVFTGSTICSHAYCQLLHIGISVRVGGLVIEQGELLHGDLNGIVSIPIDIASEVADAAPEFVRAERVVLEYLEGPAMKTPAGLAEVRSEYKTIVAQLKKSIERQ